MDETLSTGRDALCEEECRRLLASACVGRIGFSSRALPVVIPVSFALHRGDLVLPVEAGPALAAAIDRQVACLQVDERGPLARGGWSVLATGRLEEVVDEADLRAVRGLSLMPWGPSVPHHHLRLPIELVSGHRLSPAPRR